MKRTKLRSPFYLIPNELWVEIFLRLPLDIIEELRLVCRRWSEIIYSEIFYRYYLNQKTGNKKCSLETLRRKAWLTFKSDLVGAETLRKTSLIKTRELPCYKNTIKFISRELEKAMVHCWKGIYMGGSINVKGNHKVEYYGNKFLNKFVKDYVNCIRIKALAITKDLAALWKNFIFVEDGSFHYMWEEIMKAFMRKGYKVICNTNTNEVRYEFQILIHVV